MAQLPSQSSFGDYAEWPGRDVLDSGGERLGGVREIYLDRETGRPEWVLVDVDGDEARFVPLADAAVESSTIRVAHAATTVRNAPGIGAEPRIDQSEERQLYAHYGLGYSEDDSGSGLPSDDPPTQEQRAETVAPPPTAWGAADANDTTAPDTSEPASAEIVPPWRAADANGTTAPDTSEPTSSWSDAAPVDEALIDAPPPGEPPSPAELVAADIPEPPAATDRAADYETPAAFAEPALDPPTSSFDTPSDPLLDTPAEPVFDPPPPEPVLDTPPEPVLDTPPEPVLETPPEPVLETPPEPVLETPPEPVLDAPPELVLDAPPELVLDTPPEPVLDTPPPAAADTSAATSFDAPAEPVVPPAEPVTKAPPWTSSTPPPTPAPEPSGGPLALFKSRRGRIGAAVVAAAVLLFIVRRLR